MQKPPAFSFEPHPLDLPVYEIAAGVKAGRFTAVEVVSESLRRAELVNAATNAFVVIRNTEAIDAAAAADRAVAEGRATGALHGAPFAAKDLTPSRGDLTTLGSWSSGDWTPDESALVIRRLEAEGAILMGKTATPEFAFSSFTTSPRFGVTRNPWDLSRTPGGSSGGSAVAVATGVVPFAEGTDMGGSVRIPASACGVVGLKPSLGRIPMTILPSQFDNISHFGPLARSVDDAIAFMAAAAGPSDEDISSAPIPFDQLAAAPVDLAGKRFALSYDLGYYRLEPDVRDRIAFAVERIRAAGAIVEEVPLAWTRDINDRWHDVWCVFMAAFFHERLAVYRDRMDPEVLALIDRGVTLGAMEIKRTEILRSQMWRDLSAVLRTHDAFLCPTLAITAPPVEQIDDDFIKVDEEGRLLGFDMTCPFNFLPQCPAISLPLGLAANGLPVGLQAVGQRFGDEALLGLSSGLERALRSI